MFGRYTVQRLMVGGSCDGLNAVLGHSYARRHQGLHPRYCLTTCGAWLGKGGWLGGCLRLKQAARIFRQLAPHIPQRRQVTLMLEADLV